MDPLDDVEAKVDNLERAMTELERLSRAMQHGMYQHYLKRPADDGGASSAPEG